MTPRVKLTNPGHSHWWYFPFSREGVPQTYEQALERAKALQAKQGGGDISIIGKK